MLDHPLLGIIVTDKMIFTVCLEDTQVLTRFMEGRVNEFLYLYEDTFYSSDSVQKCQHVPALSAYYFDKKSEQVEEKLHFSPKNQELIELLELEKSLVVYFAASSSFQRGGAGETDQTGEYQEVS